MARARPPRAVLLCLELIDGVERQELDPVDPVEVARLDAFVDRVDDGACGAGAVVAVGDRFCEQRAAVVEQSVVDAPRVDPD